MSNPLVPKHGIDVNGHAYTRQAKAEGASAGSLGSGNFPLGTPPLPPASITDKPVDPQSSQMLSALKAMADEGQVEDNAGEPGVTSIQASLIVFHADEPVIAEVRHGDGTWDEETTLIPQGRWILTQDSSGGSKVSQDVDGEWERVSAALTAEVDEYYDVHAGDNFSADYYASADRKFGYA